MFSDDSECPTREYALFYLIAACAAARYRRTGVSPAASEAAAGDGWERSERSGSDGDELSDGSSGSGSRRNSKDLSKEDLEDLSGLRLLPFDNIEVFFVALNMFF